MVKDILSTLGRTQVVAFFALLLISAVFCGSSLAWNTPAKYIVALSILKDGKIRFTLSDDGSDTSEFLCKTSGNARQWLIISACRAGDLQCLASVNRMASALISAKLNHRKVHVQNGSCSVTEIALKP